MCKEFCNSPDERHALCIGFCEVMCPWPARVDISEEALQMIANEFHYYQIGRALGTLAWVAIAMILAVFAVLLT